VRPSAAAFPTTPADAMLGLVRRVAATTCFRARACGLCLGLGRARLNCTIWQLSFGRRDLVRDLGIVQSGGQRRHGVRDGQRVGVAGVELRVGGEHAVGQEVAELVVGPAMHDAMNDLVQVRARVDVVRYARRDDRENVASASPPSSSQVKSQFFRPRTKRLNSRSRRLLVASMFPSSRNRSSRFHCRSM
jgi:hypothetical protein